MTDLDRYLTDEMVEKAAKEIYEQWVSRDNETRMFAPMWGSLESAKSGWLRDARIALEATAPLIASAAWQEGYRQAQLEAAHAIGGRCSSGNGICVQCSQGNPYEGGQS